MKPTHPIFRVLLIVAALTLFYFLSRPDLTTLGVLSLLVAGAFLFRVLNRTRPTSGEARDFSISPALLALMKGITYLVAALAWVAVTVRRTPDSHLGTAIIFGPSLLAGIMSTRYFGKAFSLFTGGSQV